MIEMTFSFYSKKKFCIYRNGQWKAILMLSSSNPKSPLKGTKHLQNNIKKYVKIFIMKKKHIKTLHILDTTKIITISQ